MARNRSKPRIILVDENKDVVSILAGTFGLKAYEVYKRIVLKNVLKVNELDGKVDIVFVDDKIAADKAAILIIKVKRINPNIKIMVLAEDETDKTRVLEC